MLKQRVITASILAPLALYGVFGLELSAFIFLLDAVIVIAAWEWANLAGFTSRFARSLYILALALIVAALHFSYFAVSLDPLLAVAALFWIVALFWVVRYPAESGWQSCAAKSAIGIVVLMPCWLAFVQLKASDNGNMLLLFLLLLVWGADIGAYFAGKRFGKNKLAPAVSPGKTREGVYGGLAVSLLISAIFALLLTPGIGQGLILLLLALLVGAVSVLGDLFESLLKRHRGIKDSSQLLPGHGGVLDRIDSLTAAAPIFVIGLSALSLL